MDIKCGALPAWLGAEAAQSRSVRPSVANRRLAFAPSLVPPLSGAGHPARSGAHTLCAGLTPRHRRGIGAKQNGADGEWNPSLARSLTAARGVRAKQSVSEAERAWFRRRRRARPRHERAEPRWGGAPRLCVPAPRVAAAVLSVSLVSPSSEETSLRGQRPFPPNPLQGSIPLQKTVKKPMEQTGSGTRRSPDFVGFAPEEGQPKVSPPLGRPRLARRVTRSGGPPWPPAVPPEVDEDGPRGWSAAGPVGYRLPVLPFRGG